MIALKSCPRCHGDAIPGVDGELTCLQCGHELQLALGVIAHDRVLPEARRSDTRLASNTEESPDPSHASDRRKIPRRDASSRRRRQSMWL